MLNECGFTIWDFALAQQPLDLDQRRPGFPLPALLVQHLRAEAPKGMLVLVGGKEPRCPPVLAGVDPVQKQAFGLLTSFPGLP